jgi:hypothetical protein
MAIDFRTFLKLEKALIKRLRATWTPMAAAYHAQIADALKANDVVKALEIAHKIDLSPVGVQNREYIKYMLLAFLNFGAAMASETDTPLIASLQHDAVLERATKSFLASISYNCTIQTVKDALQSIALYEQAQKADGQRFVRDFVSFAEPGDAMLQLTSSLHSSRLSTWGFTAEAEVRGITEYKLSAVMDGRTSAFCRMINGHTFKVEDARKSIVQILSAENPEDAKNLQPWPAQDKASMASYKEMSSDDLRAAGYHIPPFHPRCRTILIRAKDDSQPKLTKPEVAPDNQKLPKFNATLDAFKELGLHISPEALAHWNAYVGLSPTEVLSSLTGLEPNEVLDGAAGKLHRQIVVNADGDISFTTKGDLAFGKYGTNMVYDPFTGTMYQSELAFKNADPARAAIFLKTYYKGLLDVGLSTGASSLVVAATSDSAFLHAQAGFTPSPAAWSDLKETLLADLEVGGKLEKVATTLQPAELDFVKGVLAQDNESAIYILANLPFEFEGMPVGQYLLADAPAMEMTLNLTKPFNVGKAGDTFK